MMSVFRICCALSKLLVVCCGILGLPESNLTHSWVVPLTGLCLVPFSPEASQMRFTGEIPVDGTPDILHFFLNNNELTTEGLQYNLMFVIFSIFHVHFFENLSIFWKLFSIFRKKNVPQPFVNFQHLDCNEIKYRFKFFINPIHHSSMTNSVKI